MSNSKLPKSTRVTVILCFGATVICIVGSFVNSGGHFPKPSSFLWPSIFLVLGLVNLFRGFQASKSRGAA